jgi:enterochelin esterase-like enzyme
MLGSGTQEQRLSEFIDSERFVLFALSELLPYISSKYSIDSLSLGIGGVGLGAIAAAHVALNSFNAFSRLILLSPPLQGQNRSESGLQNYRRRFETASQLPARIFQSVGRYEQFSRFVKPGRRLAESIRKHGDADLRFVETGSGHSLAAFKAIFPEALAWTFPPEDT